MLKAIYLIPLLHIQMKTQLICLKQVLRYIKYFETRSKHLLCGIKREGGGYVWLAIALKRGGVPLFANMSIFWIPSW